MKIKKICVVLGIVDSLLSALFMEFSEELFSSDYYFKITYKGILLISCALMILSSIPIFVQILNKHFRNKKDIATFYISKGIGYGVCFTFDIIRLFFKLNIINMPLREVTNADGIILLSLLFISIGLKLAIDLLVIVFFLIARSSKKN